MANAEWGGAASGNALDLVTRGDVGTQADETASKEQGRLARELERWQAEQERRFNRAWRRPGGLARPAGL